MPAGGGMDFTYGQQHEVTGGPDAGEKSRPRARETAATYQNQFMSASLQKKVVGINRVSNFQELKDTSDLKELSGQDGLFLKPIAQMNVSVSKMGYATYQITKVQLSRCVIALILL